jgi:hypothetical protein
VSFEQRCRSASCIEVLMWMLAVTFLLADNPSQGSSCF